MEVATAQRGGRFLLLITLLLASARATAFGNG